MDRLTREIVGVFTGDRSKESAKQFWKTLPPFIDNVQLLMGYCSTLIDKWKAYSGVLPSKRHRITEKGRGETNHIERFNNTLRQRVSRLVRKTLF